MVSMYYCYILELKDGTYYIGYSSDLKKRIEEHSRGRVGDTKNNFYRLRFYSAFISKKKALDFEKYLKTNSGFAFRNKRLI